uniref:Cleavage inducing molecular chaperone Jiv domain-containing protein n=1 Tax=Glossina morsitans morsitans TaxID=37546 RepID=A0A1B0GD84_GLOMM
MHSRSRANSFAISLENDLPTCSTCGLRHPRKLARLHYAPRECASSKIKHSARKGDIWAVTSMMGLRWKYLALMERKVYDITEWANCQKGALAHLDPNSHMVQYCFEPNNNSSVLSTSSASASNGSNARPGLCSMVRVPELSNISNRHSSHSRNSSWDLRLGHDNSTTQDNRCWSKNRGEYPRNPSLDFVRHSRNSSADLNKLIRNDISLVFSPKLNFNRVDSPRVQIIKAHQN